MAVSTVAMASESIVRMKSSRSDISKLPQSAMDFPLILHERMVGLRRAPPQALQNLYEELKNIKHFSDDPLFWLQYAIARLTLGDTDKSRDYFKTALALSKTTGFKPYQIEMHFCRQLLTEASDISNSDIAYKYSVEAFDTLKAQSLAQSRHHPFRASWGIEEVVYRHVEKWTPEQCKSLKNKIEFMQASADRLDPSIAKQKPVIGALQRYSNVIRKLDVRIKNEVLD